MIILCSIYMYTLIWQKVAIYIAYNIYKVTRQNVTFHIFTRIGLKKYHIFAHILMIHLKQKINDLTVDTGYKKYFI